MFYGSFACFNYILYVLTQMVMTKYLYILRYDIMAELNDETIFTALKKFNITINFLVIGIRIMIREYESNPVVKGISTEKNDFHIKINLL